MRHLFIKELKELLSNKRILVGILVVLIIFIIGTSCNVSDSPKPSTDLLQIGIVNKDDSAYSRLLLNYFNSSETFTNFITVQMGEEEEINKAYQQGKLDVLMVIPVNFANDMMYLKHSPIKISLNISDTTKAILFRNVLKSYEKYISAVEANAIGLYEIMEDDGMDSELITSTNRTLSIDLIMTALGKEKFFSFVPVSQFPTTTMAQYYVSSVLVMISLYLGLYVGYQLLQEMKQGTLTRLRTTQTPLYRFLLAKIIVAIGVMMVMITPMVTLICGKQLSAITMIFGLSIAMFCVCQAVFLSALLRETQRFILVGNLLLFYFTVVGGGIIPIQFLPQDLLLLSKFTPYYYILRGMIDINIGQAWKVYGISTGLILVSVCMMIIANLILYRRSVIYDEA